MTSCSPQQAFWSETELDDFLMHILASENLVRGGIFEPDHAFPHYWLADFEPQFWRWLGITMPR